MVGERGEPGDLVGIDFHFAVDVVEIHEADADGTWTVVSETVTDAAVSSLALDYYAERLAIGQGDAGRVTVLVRDPFTSAWTHDIDLDGPGAYGTTVGYAWGLLTVSDPASSLVMVYRDTGFQPWSTYSDWSLARLESADVIHASTGGDAVSLRLAAASVPSGGGFGHLSTYAG